MKNYDFALPMIVRSNELQNILSGNNKGFSRTTRRYNSDKHCWELGHYVGTRFYVVGYEPISDKYVEESL